MNIALFLTCPKGLENLLEQEILDLGGSDIRQTIAGVSCKVSLEQAYRLCLWSRLANRVLMPIATFSVDTADSIVAQVSAIPWQDHMTEDMTFAVDFSGKSEHINHTHFGALTVKDGIVDYFKERVGTRPNVDSDTPQLRVNARLARGNLTVSIDLSGESLHRRGYRQRGAAAPLKENLAAAILLRANWPEIAARGGALLDPMCGSGTLLLEAALIAADIAPGLNRQRWGFSDWLGHDMALWQQIKDEALLRKEQGLSRDISEIRGYDRSDSALNAAQNNIERAGLDAYVRISHKTLADFTPPTHTRIKPGLIVTNPPYGERLGDVDELVHLYGLLTQRVKENFAGWQLAVFTGNPDLAQALKMRSDKKYKLFNGAIPCELQMFTIYAAQAKAAESESSAPAELSSGAQMFANRLRKNVKQMSKWARKNDIECYRVYDADMPEYNVAVDRYGQYWQVTEYQAPSSVNTVKAVERFDQVKEAMPIAVDAKASQIFYKQRRRQKGLEQYQKNADQNDFIAVSEGQAKLWVNLKDYLDTGLFLDHRLIRLQIAAQAQSKRLLNLFCYTGVASVHAALAGAETVNVDMSATYIAWAQRNFDLNDIDLGDHEFIQTDCLQWISQQQSGGAEYDLIFLDPPSFSNSKRMTDTWDVQRDHGELIEQVMRLLKPQGRLIFSNNLRSFKLSTTIDQSFKVNNITQQTIDRDFERNAKIHQCWTIEHA